MQECVWSVCRDTTTSGGATPIVAKGFSDGSRYVLCVCQIWGGAERLV
jgi:hypothetical protein